MSGENSEFSIIEKFHERIKDVFKIDDSQFVDMNFSNKKNVENTLKIVKKSCYRRVGLHGQIWDPSWRHFGHIGVIWKHLYAVLSHLDTILSNLDVILDHVGHSIYCIA